MTRIFISEANLSPSDFKSYLWSWWQNPISKTSVRLTHAGFVFLTKTLDIEHHKMTIKSDQLGKNLKILSLLDKHITTPFYLPRRDRIVFFGSNDLIMLQLMDGNLDQYLENFT